jgi:dihydrodipicolinate synthase/N-acetylneuraminate lyase
MTWPPPGRGARPVVGMSAVLLPCSLDGVPDWDAFAAHIERTAAAGLTPAVVMDTGYGPALDAEGRSRSLRLAAEVVQGRWVGGAHVDDAPGDHLDVAAYLRASRQVADAGGIPILFPSHGLAAATEAEVVDLHRACAGEVPALLGFELGQAFHPAGRILSIEAWEDLLGIPEVLGAKHSSLRRAPELERLAVRDRVRPEFWVLTGNDLAIDLVGWGSDYLLGLSTFAPGAFALRDRLLEGGDPRWLEVDDALQALGSFAFRDPVPGYRHDAAMVAHLRGWATEPGIHPGTPARPSSDREVLAVLLERLDHVVAEVTGADGGPR